MCILFVGIGECAASRETDRPRSRSAPPHSLRLEIPCIYQKVAGNKKRKRRAKDGTEQDDDDDPDGDGDGDEAAEDAAARDPELQKAREKPFYSLLEPGPSVQSAAPMSPRKRHAAGEGTAGGESSGFALPMPDAQPFSLEIPTLDGFVHPDVHAFQGIPAASVSGIDLFPSGPLLDPSTEHIPTDDALAMFSQYYHLHTFDAPTHIPPTLNATPRNPTNAWSRAGEIPTPSAPPTLDLIFSPIGRTTTTMTPETLRSKSTESPRDQITARGYIPDAQETGERYEEGKHRIRSPPKTPLNLSLIHI